MQTETLALELPIDADIIALDKDDRIVALIEVKINQAKEKAAKQRITDRALEQIKHFLSKLSEKKVVIPYAMIVTLENIIVFKIVFKWDGTVGSEAVLSLKTADILHYYDSKLGGQRIFEPYLTRLIEAWLRDLAYNWKSEIPPASEQIAAIGLLPLLAGGTTKSRVEIGGDFIYRN
jgi:sporulation protein YlmC with PRC-barrel domain